MKKESETEGKVLSVCLLQEAFDLFLFYFTPCKKKRGKQKEQMYVMRLICLIKANIALRLLLFWLPLSKKQSESFQFHC